MRKMYFDATLDIETDGLAGKFLIGGFYSEKTGFKTFENENNFWKYILNLKNFKIYAHFGGRYDFQYMFNYILENDIKFKVIYTSKIIFIKINTLLFYDTYNLFLSSLDSLEKSFNINRNNSKDIGKNMTEAYFKANKETVKDYLFEDCKNLFDIVQKFKSKLGITKLKATIASQALDYYKTNFLNDIKFDKLTSFYRESFRNWYYGGRTEVFKRYGTDLYYYDINSSYPFVMKNFKMPISGFIETDKYIENKLAMYDIVVTDYNVKLPYLEKRINGKLCYPTGTFQAFVWNWQVKQLIKDKQKFKIVKGYIWTNIKNIFKDYIDYFYNMKLKAKETDDKALYLISKIFMNSLSGKFGERNTHNEIVKMSEKEAYLKMKDGDKISLLSQKYNLYTIETYHDAWYIQPQIIGYITSVARARLWNFMNKILENGYDLYYCDTDSIVTNANPEQMQEIGINISNELGDLKLETKIKEGFFLFPKFYYVSTIDEGAYSKNKGFVSNFEREKFYNYLFKNENLFEEKTSKVMGFKSSLSRFDETILLSEELKNVISDYQKRIVLDDNINTIPLKMDEFKTENKQYSHAYEKYHFTSSEKQKLELELKIKLLNDIDYSKYVIKNNDEIVSDFEDALPF